MVTSINDRQINHMTAGGEFNVAMDTDGLVWVWGKNDFGQVWKSNLYYIASLDCFVKEN